MSHLRPLESVPGAVGNRGGRYRPPACAFDLAVVNRALKARPMVLAIASAMALLACGGSPANANAPGGSVSIDVGSSAPYRLYTHCGVLAASINGQTYYAEPALSDGSGNQPPGWGNPYDDGDMTLRSATTADFHDSAGHTAHFTSAPRGSTPSIPICPEDRRGNHAFPQVHRLFNPFPPAPPTPFYDDGVDKVTHIRVANPAFGTRGLYVTVVRALGATPRFFKAEVMAQAQQLLEAEEAERHRRVVIVVDEAHLLTQQQLEELRLLTNSDMDSRSPFAGILLGQPTLTRQLRLGIFAALDQRIATRFHIPPMDLGDATAYLRHHLALAGRSDQLFADDAIVRLHRLSNGIPRALNNAATAALIAAASDGKEVIDDACAKKAVAELTRE